MRYTGIPQVFVTKEHNSKKIYGSKKGNWREIRRYFELKNNENVIYQKVWMYLKQWLKGNQ